MSGRRPSFTGRLLGLALRHRAVLVAVLASMGVAALTEAAPIALAKAAVGVLFPGEGREMNPFAAWFADWGLKSAEVLGLSVSEPRLAALGAVVFAIVSVGLLAAAATFASHSLGRYLAALVVKDLRCALMARVVRMPVSWFSGRKVGDLLARFSTDVEKTYTGLHELTTVFTLESLVLLAALTAAFLLSWHLALTCLVILPILVVPVVVIGTKVRKHSRRSLVSLGEATESVNQALSGLREIKAFAAEDRETERYAAVNDRWITRQCALIRAKAWSRAFLDMVYAGSLAVVLGLGGYLVVTGQWDLDSDTFVAFLVALATMYAPIRKLVKAYGDWQASVAAATRVFEILDAEERDVDRPGAVPVGPLRRGIRFEDVSFSYQESDGSSAPTLDRVSFEIPAGKTVALVGPSGAGKSTVADLIFRFRHPSSGRIWFDDVCLEDAQHRSLLDEMASVSQRPFVFNTSVRENIAYGRPDATDAEIEDAARAAQIHEVIQALPEGYDTVVGERGSLLSGGQLQRLTIARAFLKNASFLIFDEATSSLDTESERGVQVALRNLLEDRTTLVIAHRLSTIVDTDLILVMEQGRLVEQGTHEALLEQGGTYARLYRAADAD